jgi:hypothetical protein
VYRPTLAEVKRAQQLVRRTTPSTRVHGTYTDAAKVFLGVADLLPFVDHGEQRLRLETIRWQRSVLFGRDYLLAHVEDALLDSIAPECDAIATATTFVPLVLVPLRRRRARSEVFTSILEHEFVHVNQMLLGRFRLDRPGRSVPDAVTAFLEEAAVEHDANLIQLANWPRLFPLDLGVSLQHWCALRGWSAALERAVLGGYCPPHLLGRFLTVIGESAPVIVKRLGAPASVASWFAERHVGLVQSAAELHVQRMPDPSENAALLATAAWLRRASNS